MVTKYCSIYERALIIQLEQYDTYLFETSARPQFSLSGFGFHLSLYHRMNHSRIDKAPWMSKALDAETRVSLDRSLSSARGRRYGGAPM
jgi:hypothetical protein